jgi:Transposase IS116/IS110/IS902 family
MSFSGLPPKICYRTETPDSESLSCTQLHKGQRKTHTSSIAHIFLCSGEEMRDKQKLTVQKQQLGCNIIAVSNQKSNFSSTRKVAAYVGFDPMEDSSTDRKAYGGISKAGSRLLRYLLIEAGQTAAKDDEQIETVLSSSPAAPR